jgi:predicted transcriptional regulator
MEGERARLAQAGQVIRRDVLTCGLNDRLRDVQEHARADGWNVCIVVDHNRVVLGRLRRETWDGDPEASVESVMENGPSTVRPDSLLEPLVKRMQERKVGSTLVANSDGVLLGLLNRADAEAFLAKGLREEQPPVSG